MAEGKKSFTAYCDWSETFNSLPDDKAGQLIKHIFAYVNDQNPQTDDILIKAVFAQIKNTLKRDLEKWEKKKEERSKSGILGNLKRYQKDLYEAVVTDIMSLDEAQKIAKCRIASNSDTKLAVRDSVRVSVTDSVIQSSYDDGVLKPVDDLLKIYLASKIPEAIISNPDNKIKSIDFLKKRLSKFTEHCKQQGKLSRTFSDYCSHFLSWNLKNKPINGTKKRGILNN